MHLWNAGRRLHAHQETDLAQEVANLHYLKEKETTYDRGVALLEKDLYG